MKKLYIKIGFLRFIYVKGEIIISLTRIFLGYSRNYHIAITHLVNWFCLEMKITIF